MKLRMIITALCLCLGLCAMAQGNGNRSQGAGQGNWGGNMVGNNWGDDNTQNGAIEDAK